MISLLNCYIIGSTIGLQSANKMLRADTFFQKHAFFSRRGSVIFFAKTLIVNQVHGENRSSYKMLLTPPSDYSIQSVVFV